jgi:sulfur-carrier protein
MKVNVKYFASIREAVGRGTEALETSARTCGELREELITPRASPPARQVRPHGARSGDE